MASPARSQFYDIALDTTAASATFGKPVSTTKVTVYVAVPQAATAQTTLASIFTNETGATTPGNPFFATTGEINFWVGSGTYDLKIEDTAVPAKFATRIVRFDGLPYDAGITNAMLADSIITSAKIVDGTIAQADLSAAVIAAQVKTGMILPFAGLAAAIPSGYVACDGSVVASATYPALDALFGAAAPAGATHAYNNGVSPGAGNFKLPDLRGRVPIGLGASTANGGTTWALSTSTPITGPGGEEKHLLLAAESGVAAHSVTVSASQSGHSHNVITNNAGGNSPFGNGSALTSGSSLNTGGNAPSFQFSSNGSFAYQFNTDTQTPAISASGSASAANAASSHNIMQPHAVVNFIVKT